MLLTVVLSRPLFRTLYDRLVAAVAASDSPLVFDRVRWITVL